MIVKMLQKCEPPLSSEIDASASLFKLQLILIEQGLIFKESHTTLSYQDDNAAIFCVVFIYVAGLTHVTNVYISPGSADDSVDEFRGILCDELCQRGLAMYSKYIDESEFREGTLKRIVEAISPNHVLWKYWDRFDSYILNEARGEDLEVETGFEIRELGISMAENLCDSHYASSFEDERLFFHNMVGNNFTERPSFGVFNDIEGNTPLCSASLYQNGSLGMLHTVPEYRRRGFARALVRYTIKEIYRQSNSDKVPISCCIMEETTASQNLMISEGFVKQKVNCQSFLVSSKIRQDNGSKDLVKQN